MTNTSTSATATVEKSPPGDKVSASTITVKTKTPAAAAAAAASASASAAAAAFPPPKTDKPRPHVCGTCQRSFARLEHLKRHERSHTKEKPFECPECTRCFARRDLLLRHQQKLHQTTTPSSRPRNRRESASGAAAAAANRARKSSVAGSNAAAAAAASANASMRPRANTISHIDGTAMQMMASANANMARGIPPTHSRHPSLIGLPVHGHGLEHTYAGMASAMTQRGMAHGLPKLETHGIHNLDFSGGLRTAPPMAFFSPEFDFEGLLFGAPGSTINPNALHYNDSPQSMALDPVSPFAHHGLPDMTGQRFDDGFDWLTGFEQQMSFQTDANETAVDESSPSAISTTSQSGISDVMLDGSNHAVTTAGAGSSMWQPGIMAPPPVSNPFALDLGNSVFPDLMNGAPVSPQPPGQKNGADTYFSTPPASMSSLSPSVVAGLSTQKVGQTLNFGASPETPSSMNGSSHGSLPVATITDSTRRAILGALSAAQPSPLSGRRDSFATATPSMAQRQATPSTGSETTGVPATHDLQRFVGAYLQCFHPHLPFLHVPTLSFDMPAGSGSGRAGSVAGGSGSGSGSLLLSMAAIGALYENEEQQSRELFAMAKRMIQLYLDERRKASVRKADFRRSSVSESRSHPQEQTVDAPVWLVQAMLLNVVYGHNCGDKRSGEIALTHAAALVSLAQGAELLRPVRVEPVEDLGMTDGDAMWGFGGRPGDAEDHAEWMRWKSVEERKRTLYVIFILSSLLVSAYNHTPALTNSEILLDLPSDEDFFAAETSTAFYAKGGIAAANRNRMTFHEALGALLKANEWEQQQQQQQRPSSAPRRDGQQVLSPTGPGPDAAASGMQPSTFGCLILIHALHNYIWETRQRHHNKTWTHEEMEKMHRHMEPALKAWQAAWSSNPLHSLQRPNPFGMGPLSADSMPLLDLAYIRLFLDFSRSKEKFWQRDWDGVAEELGRGRDAGPHAEHSPASNAESAATDASDSSGNSSVSVDSPCTQPSSPGFSTYPATLTRASPLASTSRPTGGREKLLRKAALYAANSFCMSDELGVGLADLTRRELPIQSAMCALDCAQVLAEWVATLQDRVGRYLGILGLADVDLTQVPAIMLLEEEDVKLLGRIQDILAGAGPRTKMETGVAGRAVVDEHAGYAANLLRVTASMMGKAAVWPVTRLMVSCLETHAEHMRARAERSVLAAAQ